MKFVEALKEMKKGVVFQMKGYIEIVDVIGREVMEAYFSIKESNKTIESEMSFLR